MNDRILGGRDQCDKCGEFHNNVSYHSSHECKNSEWSYDGLHETWSRIENGTRVWYDEKPSELKDILNIIDKPATVKPKEHKLVDKILNEIKNDEAVAKLSYKQLGDYLIEKYWADEEWGSYNCSVLDRVIRILFELNDDYKENEKENKKDI